MLFETNKDKGRAGMAIGIAWFGSNGYTINIPLSDTQWYDFVAEKDGHFYTVQCKATGSEDGTIDLRSTGGTDGGVYDNVKDHPLDYLFCLDAERNVYVIPVNEITSTNSIKLRKEPNANRQGFETYKYLVEF